MLEELTESLDALCISSAYCPSTVTAFDHAAFAKQVGLSTLRRNRYIHPVGCCELLHHSTPSVRSTTRTCARMGETSLAYASASARSSKPRSNSHTVTVVWP